MLNNTLYYIARGAKFVCIDMKYTYDRYPVDRRFHRFRRGFIIDFAPGVVSQFDDEVTALDTLDSF